MKINNMDKELLNNPGVKQIVKEILLHKESPLIILSDQFDTIWKNFVSKHTIAEWEIIQYIIAMPDRNLIWTKYPDGKFRQKENGVSLSEKIIESGEHAIIQSVKRLSDGEIFSVGDKVENTNGKEFVISVFYLASDNNHMLCNGDNTGDGHINITKIEKVKQWEIISYKTPTGIYNKDQHGFKFSEINGHPIYSIQRLSDKEIFTVGDKTNRGEILSFKIFQDSMRVDIPGQCIGGTFPSVDISAINKAKELFITEDGQKIYEGDSVYYVSTDKYISLGVQHSSSLVIGSKESFDKNKQLTFHDIEVANEYVLMNIPYLSVREVGNIIYGFKHHELELKELVQNKIKNAISN